MRKAAQRDSGYHEVVRRHRLEVHLKGLPPLEVWLQFVHFEQIIWKEGVHKNILICFQCIFGSNFPLWDEQHKQRGGGGVMGKKFLTREVGRKLVSEGKKKKLVIFFNQQTHKEVT